MLINERSVVDRAHRKTFARKIRVDRAKEREVADVTHGEEGVFGRRKIRRTLQVRGAVGDAKVRTVRQPGEDAFGCGVGFVRRRGHVRAHSADPVRDGGMNLLNVDQGPLEGTSVGAPRDVHRGFGGRLFTCRLQVHDGPRGGRWRVERRSHLVSQVHANQIADVPACADGDGAVDQVALGAEAEDRVPPPLLREGEAVLDDLGVHPFEDRGSGGTADAIINVGGEDDTTELVVEAIDGFVVKRDLEADADERGTKLLGEEQARSLNGAVDRLVELHAHAFAVRSDDWVEAGRLIDVDIRVDVGVEVGAVEVEVEVDPSFDNREDDHHFDGGAARARGEALKVVPTTQKRALNLSRAPVSSVLILRSDGTSSWQKRHSGMSARSAAVDRKALRAGSSACTDRR